MKPEQIDKEFLSMPLRPATMTFYSVRTSIRNSVRAASRSFYGRVLDVGCGFMPYRGLIEGVPAVTDYVGLDLAQPTYYGDVEPDLKWDGKRIPTGDETFECVMATEFLEHHPDPENALAEIRRVIKPGGIFFATVPFIWNLHEIPHDEYRYTPFSLERHMRAAGFNDIRIKALGGWNMAFAQMLGLWLGFSPMHHVTRRILQIMTFPVYAILVKTDQRPQGFDGFERSMFNGLSVTARR